MLLSCASMKTLDEFHRAPSIYIINNINKAKQTKQNKTTILLLDLGNYVPSQKQFMLCDLIAYSPMQYGNLYCLSDSIYPLDIFQETIL